MSKLGARPGSLIYLGEERDRAPRLRLFRIRPDQALEAEVKEWGEIGQPAEGELLWINIDGLHEVALIERIGRDFGIHPLVLEDILNTGHRPKLENYQQLLFVVVRMLRTDPASGELRNEQVSLVVGSSWVLSFQEEEGDVFDPVRERLRQPNGRVRTRGADYLAYALLDMIVDHYFEVLEELGEALDKMDEEILKDPTAQPLREIHRLKYRVAEVRKCIWPMREIVSGLQRKETGVMQEDTGLYLRDLYDHVLRAIDTVEWLRDVAAGLMDLQLSVASHRMNEVMKVLTIIATIFIPLTFIAGIYGMNFTHMPELAWEWGYPLAMGLMTVVALIMVAYFKRKSWF